ncbi:MAG: DUF389 domain-containing protein [Thermoflexibacter sp.]
MNTKRKNLRLLSKLYSFFNLTEEQETYEQIVETITKGVVFTGTNLWVLVFAIFVASVGLNVNSTAVIIGAMLISPLMGPIIGIGLGLGTYDLELIKKSIKNLSFAVIVSLSASTIYFLISPLNQAHSELFARTSPNIYDVLIAFFGGLAGIAAITSKQKGNALQGAAIATALMPPLCTAGFGIATLQWNFFFGAFYLFIINSVFISLATYLTVRLLKFPAVRDTDMKHQLFLKRIVFVVVIFTLIPSIYLGYQLTQQERFNLKVSQFIEKEFTFPDSYLLNKTIDFPTRTISLVIGGSEIDSITQASLAARLKLYNLENTQIFIKNALSFQSQYQQIAKEGNDKISFLNNEIVSRQREISVLKSKLDSISNDKVLEQQIVQEIQTQYPDIAQINLVKQKDAKNNTIYRLYVSDTKGIRTKNWKNIKNWLQVRLNNATVIIYVTKEQV